MPETASRVTAEEIDLYTEWSDAQENVAAASRQLTLAKGLYDSAVARVHASQAAIDAWLLKQNEKIPVDTTARTLVDGSPVPADQSHLELKPNGQQRDYIVLSAEERAKGFVRPVRRSYIHEKCGVLTTMSQALAETYARKPDFYTGTFCCGCGTHFPVGADGEFVWDGTSEKVGT